MDRTTTRISIKPQSWCLDSGSGVTFVQLQAAPPPGSKLPQYFSSSLKKVMSIFRHDVIFSVRSKLSLFEDLKGTPFYVAFLSKWRTLQVQLQVQLFRLDSRRVASPSSREASRVLNFRLVTYGNSDYVSLQQQVLPQHLLLEGHVVTRNMWQVSPLLLDNFLFFSDLV